MKTGRISGMTATMSFGYDGDGGLRDRLLAAVLRGEMTARSSLAIEYVSGEPLLDAGRGGQPPSVRRVVPA